MIIDFKDLSSISDEKTICIPGCFDLFHVGHVELFKKVKTEYPEYKLVVGVASNTTIKNIKGNSRPIISQNDRVLLVDSCTYVDYAFISPSFGDDFENRRILRIKDLKPNFLVYGDLSKIKQKKEFENIGVQLIEINSDSLVHTTEIIEKIKKI
jgi:cytidyltransferase-like protein